MYAGTRDAISMLAISSGLVACMPWAAANPPLAIGAMLAAAGGSGALGLKSLLEKADPVNENAREGFIVKSDEPYPECMGEAGLRLGYTMDHNKAVDITNDIAQRHICIVGQSGVGKTVLGEWLLYQQIVRGGGFLFIDAKLDQSTRDRLWALVNSCGRQDDFYVINPADPGNSNTYNPILYGSGSEVASRLLNLLPNTENSPGSDHYKQTANQALMCLVAALKSANKMYHFGDLSVLLQSPRALDQLSRIADQNSDEGRALQVFLGQYRMQTKNGVEIDMKKIKDSFGGIAGRISTFAQGTFGKVFNTITPEVDMTDVVLNNKMVLVMLPTMGQDTAALSFAKMCVSDLRTAVANVQGLPKEKRPNPPFIAFLDEFGSYVMPGVATLFEQARSAQICLIPAFQAFANLTAVSPEFSDRVIQNTWTKCFFKFGSQEAEEAAELLGASYEFAVSYGEGQSDGMSTQSLRTDPTAQETGSVSTQKSYRQSETFRVKPDKLRALGMGQCFVQIGPRTYHIRTPMLKIPNDDAMEEFRAVRRHVKLDSAWEPCGYESHYREYITQAGEGA